MDIVDVKIPYGKGFVAYSGCANVLTSQAHSYISKKSESEHVKDALENPIGTEKLCKMAESKKTALVITSDHTRPVPSSVTLPPLLSEIRKNNPNIKIKILIATGFHRPTTKDELIAKCGKELAESEEFINHISTNDDDMVFKGIMPSGGELWLNKLVDWADIIVSEGFIEPHFFAGFSGGRKSILPGIASAKTVLANHCSEFIASDKAKTGNLDENPIHRDMLFAAQKAGLKFILNVVIDSDKKVIAAFAGDSVEAHHKGCEFVKNLAHVSPSIADIVISSNGGYPLDQNIYQSVKGMTAAEATVKKGGVIIMVAACNDGHGGEGFYKWFAQAESPQAVLDKIGKIDRRSTLPDQWEAQILARILCKATVIMVTQCDRAVIEAMHMKYASTIGEALDMAKKYTNGDKITVIPDGVSVIVG